LVQDAMRSILRIPSSPVGPPGGPPFFGNGPTKRQTPAHLADEPGCAARRPALLGMPAHQATQLSYPASSRRKAHFDLQHGLIGRGADALRGGRQENISILIPPSLP